MTINEYKVGRMHTSSKFHAVVETTMPFSGAYLHLMPICKMSSKGNVASAFQAPAGTEVTCLRCVSRAARLEEYRLERIEKQAARAARQAK